jgi:hypothetical protein
MIGDRIRGSSTLHNANSGFSRSIPFLGRAELIANKRAAGRRKDLEDVEALGEDPAG